MKVTSYVIFFSSLITLIPFFSYLIVVAIRLRFPALRYVLLRICCYLWGLVLSGVVLLGITIFILVVPISTKVLTVFAVKCSDTQVSPCKKRAVMCL
mgnify:CR=1 FL=1